MAIDLAKLHKYDVHERWLIDDRWVSMVYIDYVEVGGRESLWIFKFSDASDFFICCLIDKARGYAAKSESKILSGPYPTIEDAYLTLHLMGSITEQEL